MVPAKDPNLKGIGFSFCFLPVVSRFLPLLVGMESSVGNLWEESNNLHFTEQNMVPRAGLEPARPFGLGILSPLCLPFHHRGIACLLGF